MQREQVLNSVLQLLEQQGLSGNIEILLKKLNVDVNQSRQFWPDDEALLYDCLRYHSQQIATWQRQLQLNDELSPEEKLLARYNQLAQKVTDNRFLGCLFIAACSIFPNPEHPIHQLSEQQKQLSFNFSLELLRQLDIDDSEQVAKQMELILEGCLSKLLVKRNIADVLIAKLLAEDILIMAKCRKNDALN